MTVNSFPEMPPIVIDIEGERKLLLNIDVSKAIGPDQIPNRALKMAADEVAPVLQHLFQQSLDLGDLPEDWRRANITPIHKKGTFSDPVNYRPVSLTCVCCKLLEHIVDSNLMVHLTQWNIHVLSDNQHAFRKASCETQLILTTHDLTKNFDAGYTTDVAILDFAKAINVMPHQSLLTKLDFYGIHSKTKQWISSVLTRRSQRVMVNGKSSDWVQVQ